MLRLCHYWTGSARTVFPTTSSPRPPPRIVPSIQPSNWRTLCGSHIVMTPYHQTVSANPFTSTVAKPDSTARPEHYRPNWSLRRHQPPLQGPLPTSASPPIPLAPRPPLSRLTECDHLKGLLPKIPEKPLVIPKKMEQYTTLARPYIGGW